MKPFKFWYTAKETVPPMDLSRSCMRLYDFLAGRDPRAIRYPNLKAEIDHQHVINSMRRHPAWIGQVVKGPFIVPVVNSIEGAPEEISIWWSDGDKTFVISQQPITGMEACEEDPLPVKHRTNVPKVKNRNHLK